MQGSRLGSYELIRRLGEGGMAQVYLARDVRLGREVAVKVLDRHLAQRSGFRDRFLREARVVAVLDHPNIVPVYEIGESGGVLFLVMPYLSGGSLQDALKRVPFPVGEVVSYGTQITDALDYAHQRGVIHRDVKPANMLLHADGRLMLADFGLAKILDGAPRPANRVGKPDAGTPEYMAPEQIQGRTDERSDLYGLGVVLYLLLTGRLPFTGASANAVMDGHLYRLPDPPRNINRAVTPALDEVVLRALAKHPEDRFQRASEMGAALLEALVAGEAEPPDLGARSSSPVFSSRPVFSRPPSLEPAGLPPYPSPFSPGSGGAPGPYGARSGGHSGSTTSFLPSLDVPAAHSPFSAASSAGSAGSRPVATGAPYPSGGIGEPMFPSAPREYLPTQPLGGMNLPSGMNVGAGIGAGMSLPSDVAVADPLSQISQGMRVSAMGSPMGSALSPAMATMDAGTVASMGTGMAAGMDADALDDAVRGRSRWVWFAVAGLLIVLALAAGGLAWILL